jgi:1,5-rhamnosyltransferase
MTVYFLGWQARYEQIMIEHLAQSHPVRMFRLPAYARRVVRLARALGGAAPLLKWLGKRVSAINGASASDLLVCNEGQLKRGRQLHLVQGFAGKRVLLVRDLVDAAFVARMRPLFDRIYSYDPVQCEQLGMEPLEQFFPFDIDDARQQATGQGAGAGKPQCFFLGRDKGRAQRLHTLAQVLEGLGCDLDFQIVKDDTTQVPNSHHVEKVLSYEANLAKAKACDVLVEINQPGQAGLTLRPLEAAFFDKKLITDNRRVRDTAFYHPDRFYVLGDEQRDLQTFLASKAPVVAVDALHKHTPTGMLERLLEDVAHR